MTDTHLANMAAELSSHHNEICLVHDSELARLIGVGRDDHDCYYIVQQRGHNRRHGGENNVLWSSAVGAIQPLKGRLDDEDYIRLENTFSLNGCPPTSEFAVEDQGIWDLGLSVRSRLVSKCGRFVLSFDEQNPDDRFSLWRCYPDAPGTSSAKILNGEMAVLEDLAARMIREMEEWATLQSES